MSTFLEPNKWLVASSDDPPGEPETTLDLSIEGQEALADVAWMRNEYNKGTFDAYRGEYVAIHRKTIVGHHASLLQLREQVAQETGIPAGRLVTTFISRRTG
jgi:hypothetical protein